MHRIDTTTAQKDKFGAGKDGFTRGNPQTGTPATDLDDDYFDMLQEELASVVESAGYTLDKTKHNQLLTALKSMFSMKNIIVFSNAGVTSWNVPDELKNGRKAKVTVIGGGGSGGRNGGGGGAGGGGIAIKMVDLTGIATVQVTVGAGGAAIPLGNTPLNGNNGGASSFGAYCSATGGVSGGNQSGGNGGIGVGGEMNSSTGPGNPGTLGGSASSPTYNGGSGGGAGGPGVSSGTSINGQDAVGPGGGGGGAAWGNSPQNCVSGRGFNGSVIIEW